MYYIGHTNFYSTKYVKKITASIYQPKKINRTISFPQSNTEKKILVFLKQKQS